MDSTSCVLVPIKDNDGCDVPAEVFDYLMLELKKKFGGYTLMPEAFGEWLDRHGVFRADIHRPVLVNVPESRIGELDDWVKWVGQELRQEAMLLLRNFCEPTLIQVETY